MKIDILDNNKTLITEIHKHNCRDVHKKIKEHPYQPVFTCKAEEYEGYISAFKECDANIKIYDCCKSKISG